MMGKLLVYACHIGIRSSWAIQRACRHSRDLLWLMRSLASYHDTIAAFRRKHRKDFTKMLRFSLVACVDAGGP